MNCPVTLTGIETACGSNMAGVKEVWLGNFGAYVFTDTDFSYQETADSTTENPQYVLDIDGNKIKKTIKTATIATGGKVMAHYAFRKQTASATNTLTVNDNGTNFWENAISMVFSKQDTEKRLAIMSIMQGETCAIVKDNNDKLWYYGLENGLTMTDGSVETGTAFSDNNAYTITVSTSERILPLPIETAAFNTLTQVSNS